MKLFRKDNIDLETLIQGCVDNDRRCQELLYKRYFDLALRIVRRYTKDQETQLHIINSGFLRIFKKIDKYQGTGSFEGWMGKLIFREVSNHFRKKQSQFKFIEVESNQTSPVRNEGLDDLVYQDLKARIKTLPDSSRKVFELFAIEGYSHKEISEQLEISEGTSKWHVSNARSILKKSLEKDKYNQKKSRVDKIGR